IATAEVLRESEMGDVLVEELGRLSIPPSQADLDLDRVGLHVDQPPRLSVLREWLGAAVEIHDELGRAIQFAELAPVHAEASVNIDGVVRPPPREAEAGHHALQEGCGPG